MQQSAKELTRMHEYSEPIDGGLQDMSSSPYRSDSAVAKSREVDDGDRLGPVLAVE